MPNLSEAEANEYRRLKHVEATLLNSPVRKEFFQVYKKADPNAKIPELEQEEAAIARENAKFAKLEEELKDTRQRLLERDAAEANARQRERLTRAPFNLTESEIDEVITYQSEMHKNGELVSLETAARAYLQIHQVPSGRSQPRLAFSTRGQRPKNDFRKALKDPKSRLFTDPRGYVKEQADEAREELREAFGEVLI